MPRSVDAGADPRTAARSSGSPSDPHALAPSLPKAANGGLRDTRSLARFDPTPPHWHDGLGVRIGLSCALDESADAAVFHGDEARRSDKVVSLEAYLQKVLIVVLEAEYGPKQFALFRSARD